MTRDEDGDGIVVFTPKMNPTASAQRKTRSGATSISTNAQSASEKSTTKKKSQSTTWEVVEVTDEMLEEERERLLVQKQTEKEQVLNRHDDLVRFNIYIALYSAQPAPDSRDVLDGELLHGRLCPTNSQGQREGACL